MVIFICLAPLTDLYRILVWFKRSLHSAQVSGQNLMTLQVEEAMWIRTRDYGRLLGKWVKESKNFVLCDVFETIWNACVLAN